MSRPSPKKSARRRQIYAESLPFGAGSDALEGAPPDAADTRGPEDISDWSEVLADSDVGPVGGGDSGG